MARSGRRRQGEGREPAGPLARLLAAERIDRYLGLLVSGLRNHGVMLLDAEGHVASWNAGAERIHGFAADEIVGRHFSALYPPEDVAAGKPERELEDAARAGSYEVEGWRRRKDGSRFFAEVVLVALREEQGRLAGFGQLTRDLTERFRHEQELAARARQEQLARERLDSLVESLPDAVVTVDREGRIVLVNAQAERLFGYSREELLGQPVEKLLPDRLRVLHAANRERYYLEPRARPMGIGLDLVARRKDGTEVPVEISLSAATTEEGLLVTSVITDISERKRLEQELRHAQRMEALGRLAGGIAHDFNNLLLVIGGYTSLALAAVDESNAEVRSYLEQVGAAAQSAASLTAQLLSFSRKKIVEPRVVDPNEVVAGMEAMLRRLLDEDIVLVTSLGEDVASVYIDPAQLEQVIANLVVNACDAMPAGGRLLVETRNVAVNETWRRQLGMSLPPGEYVVLGVSDQGVGMDAETARRAFEPFFTTKEPGKGTGLGLSTVHGIVAQAGGEVAVHSVPGLGTTVRVYLPRAEGGPEPAVAAEAPLPRGTETVLLVEDDELVRGLVVELLERQGYTVLQAGSSDAALELFGVRGSDVDLLVTDLVLPGLSGRELADRLRRIRPGLKVLWLSGYGEAVMREAPEPSQTSSTAFLGKPFSAADLARAVRDLLDR